ncbi:glutamine--fructose-6-phosphate transaminase (isomerizing) [Miltoncostaea marina]|uniref:glutamine--fructose-6-phosphate transaminase (isomerizing) n=1 Tax=Miltoncostaea marina TaxID=2843215 RepID=UPI001C3CCFB5|nr:glutamine--fructose-6-phosphate transaminase (isomerizing) [Miltoncostaea marina]
MCGIIGYVGGRACRELILSGLERLEYRGYDSAGFALLDEGDGVVETVRAVGNLARLRAAAGEDGGSDARLGLGHTRWATHGRVTTENAHPHSSADGAVMVVMNGIIENYLELRHELQDEGVVFASETDTEVIPHLIAREYDGDLASAVRAVLPRLGGHFAFVAAHVDEPGRLVASRRECPLVLGVGDGERFVASAIPAFLRETRDIVVIEDDEVVAIEADGLTIWDGAEIVTDRAVQRVDWDEDAAEKGGYETFMLKEIHEQPSALWDTIGDRLKPDGSVDLPELGLDDAALARVERIHIVACGTSYHAGLVGRYLIEDWARVPVHCEVASEYRYRTCLAGPGDLVIGITQSGETADTLAAMRVARERGAHVVALTNIMGSQATRDADGVLYTRAGLEIGVAATKTHTAQVMALSLLALKLGRLKWALTAGGALDLADELRRIPDAVEAYLASPAPAQVMEVAASYADRPFFLYLGRHVGVPVSFEGALKLKEISYIPTEAYPAGEMKHGPIALLDEGSPVVVVATDGHVFDKVVSNIQEVRARGARVIAVATEGNSEIERHADDVLWAPRSPALLSSITAVLPLQIFAYGLARARGLNVDQPRNLAKTVTVE